MSMEIQVLEYLHVSYILVIIFGMQAIKSLFPVVRKPENVYRVVVIFSLVLAIVFFFIDKGTVENVSNHAVKLVVSFLVAAGSYDFIIKPFKKFFNAKSNNSDSVDTTDNSCS